MCAPAAKELEDGSGLLPTFHKETMAVDQSMTVDVDLDQQADDIDIRPLPGKLFRVSGKVLASPPVPVTVSLISDVGRVQTKTVETFVFEHVAPGNYQLIAEATIPTAAASWGPTRRWRWTATGIAGSPQFLARDRVSHAG
jgi:hypothetical protein